MRLRARPAQLRGYLSPVISGTSQAGAEQAIGGSDGLDPAGRQIEDANLTSAVSVQYMEAFNNGYSRGITSYCSPDFTCSAVGQAVPEPASHWLALAGFALLAVSGKNYKIRG